MSMPRSMLAPVALVVAALAGPALAADGKTMPGSACEPKDDSRPGQLYWGNGNIANLGNAQQPVNCAVVKDLNKIRRAVVMVIDLNPDPGADISCQLVTVRSDGTVQAAQDQRSNGSFTVARPLSFGAQAAAANGSYHLECSLPPFRPGFGASTIINYTIVED
jgi:hypothetical protein